MSLKHFAVVGAGLAGVACARRLAAAGHRVTLFEKSRAVGGRMATRRREAVAWDHGAQYFTVGDGGFAAVVEAARQAGQVDAWTPRWPGGEQEQRSLWVGVPGISALPRWLAAGLELVAATRIEALRRDGAGWLLQDDAGREFPGFDGVALALPAPQAALLAAVSPAMVEELAVVEMAPCWAALVAFERRLEADCDADWSPDPVLPWLARNSSKPRRSGLDAWVLHADAGWSRRHLERDGAEVARLLLERLSARLSRPLPPVAALDAQRWRHARVTRPLGRACLLDAGNGLGACGDWCLDARVEAAFLSGDALGTALAGLHG